MLNEPTDGGDSASETGSNNEAGNDGGGLGVADSLMSSTGLTMTPQDRESIERVSADFVYSSRAPYILNFFCHVFFFFAAASIRFSGTSRSAGILCMRTK